MKLSVWKQHECNQNIVKCHLTIKFVIRHLRNKPPTLLTNAVHLPSGEVPSKWARKQAPNKIKSFLQKRLRWWSNCVSCCGMLWSCGSRSYLIKQRNMSFLLCQHKQIQFYCCVARVGKSCLGCMLMILSFSASESDCKIPQASNTWYNTPWSTGAEFLLGESIWSMWWIAAVYGQVLPQNPKEPNNSFLDPNC